MKKIFFLGILAALFFTSPSLLRAEELKSPALPQVQTYDQLVSAIRQARAASQARVEQAVQQEKVREAWETGKLIDEHVLQHKERADYAQQVISRLSSDLGLSDRELYYNLRFYRLYPILPHASKLSWSEYRELLSVEDAKERQALAEKTEKEGWTRDQVRDEVRKRKGIINETPAPVQEEKLFAKPGRPGTYRLVKATVGPETGKQVIDLGFSNYYRTSRDLGLKEGSIIETAPGVPGSASTPNDKIRLSKRTSADLYTYLAYVVRVLDGDTLEVVADLGFGVRSVQTLRLRGLDCPELVSKEGKEAKAFVEKILGKAEGAQVVSPFEKGGARGILEISPDPSLQKRGAGKSVPVLIKTTKSDKYDRYLADVFIDNRPKTADRSPTRSETSDYLYLNNLLLEQGHAIRVKE